MADLGPLWLSVQVASAATALIVLCGVPVAFLLARWRFVGKGLVSGLLILPLVLPPTVLGYLLLQLLGRRTWLGAWLEATLGVSLVFHWSGAVVASAVTAFPLFLLPSRGAFEGVDPALEDAARLLGRGELSVFRSVTLPLAWRGLAGGTVLAFARSLGDFGATMMVAGNIPGLTQTASLAIYDAVQAGDPARGAALPLDIGRLHCRALAGAAHAASAGSGTLSAADCTLEARLVKRIHAGLTVDVRLLLGARVGVLFGPSGSGKTSILRMIAGLSHPDEGSVRLGATTLFDAVSRIDVPLRRRRIGMIFQDDLLFPHLSVRDNIRFGLKGWSRVKQQVRLAEIASLCGVEHLLGRRPITLSGGERQRVGLARSLRTRPRLLLCDEPVSALDLPNRQSMVERLRDVQASEGIPVLYVTHSPAEAVTMGTHLFFLEGGKISAEGSPLDVLGRLHGPSFGHLEDLRNILPARVLEEMPGKLAMRLQVQNGPQLIVPHFEALAGAPVFVMVRAEDIILARGPIAGLSAQNLVAGTIERIVAHGPDAEAVVRTGGVTWIASVVTGTVEQLGLHRGQEIYMVIKARSCHVSPGSPARPSR